MPIHEGQERELCGHCGKRRKLKTLLIEKNGEVRYLDVCRPCGQAIKEAMRRETWGEAEKAKAAAKEKAETEELREAA